MGTANLRAFIQRLTCGAAAQTLAEQPDRRLVELILEGRAEAAFEALVHRHGPMVYRVCWRILQQAQDAEDAFQATFLILAQKLSAVRKRASLASWLHGVAHRVAIKARARAATRRRHERQAPASRPVPSDDVTWGELRLILDAEVARLPEKWRLPLILCYLEGRTQDEAAADLNWGKNTLRRRLGEARAALARRLSRQGVWPAALGAVLLADCAASAAVPPGLLVSTMEAATRVAGGQAAAAVAPAKVVALTEGVQTAMPLTKTNLAIALFAAVGFVVAAATDLPAFSATPEPPAQQQGETPTRPKEPPAEGKQDRAEDALAGRWLMTLPKGFQYQVVVRPLGEKRYSVEKAVRFSGVYEFRGTRLMLVKGANPAEKDFEWKLRSRDELVLVAQPPVNKVGSNYLGATLKRLADDNGPAAPKGKDTADGGPAPKGPGGGPPDEAGAARALERIRAEYKLRKEPAYRAPVQYCLLLLGGDNPARLWLASDGVTLYVDRNGNGDLTEPGESVPFKAEGFASFGTASFPDGGAVQHKDLHIAVRQRDWENNKGGYWAIRANVGGRYPMYAFAHKFAKKSEDAPVIHLGGPLRMGLYALDGGSLVRGGQSELNAYVACQYPGVEKAFVDVDHWTRKDVHPVAEVRLPAEAKAEPLTLRVPLTKRC